MGCFFTPIKTQMFYINILDQPLSLSHLTLSYTHPTPFVLPLIYYLKQLLVF